VGARFILSASDAEFQLLAYGVLEDCNVGLQVPPGPHQRQAYAESWRPSQSSDLPAFQPSNLPRQTRLTLYWQTLTSLDKDYTVFVHSLSGEGKLLGQADGPPVGNHYPTSLWLSGEIVQDSRLVPAGDRYLVGLYDPVSGERLPAFGSDGTRLPDDAVVLARDEY
jgi:hypothetical protein